MTTREFLENVRDHLAPGGVVVTNVIGSLEGPSSKLFRSMYKTYRSVFPTVVVHPVDGLGRSPQSVGNLILVAGDGVGTRRGVPLRRWNEIRRSHPDAPDLTRAILDRRLRPVETDDVPLLTDDYAPTDALLYAG